MKRNELLICGIFLLGLIVPQWGNAQTTQQLQEARVKQDINQQWSFHRGELNEKEVSDPGFDDSQWEKVNVPHVMKLSSNELDNSSDTSSQLTFQRYIGYYRKELKVEATKEQKVFLEFEGAHQNTKLWVNGEFVGQDMVSGFTPFSFDVTDYVKKDGSANSIVLSVDNRPNPVIPPDGDRRDYILYSGLYRDVYLVVKNPVHITFDWEDKYAGVFITTPTISKSNATINIRSTVKNTQSTPSKTTVVQRVVDKEGYVVTKATETYQIAPKASHTFQQTTGITENLRRWSIDDPYLYKVQTLVYQDDQLMDVVENPLGIRQFDFIHGEGFLLNGENIELVGVNKHQQYPYVGDAVANSLHRKDAEQFKETGYNVVRLAHYPHDNAFIEACDELGILLIEEAPSWIHFVEGEWFDNLEEATRIMIRNHRNHPSILMWSGGLNHRGPVERLHYACKEEDPTRMTGSNGAPWTGPVHSGVCDIYTPMDYQNMPVTENDFSFLCEHGSSDDALKNQFEVSKSKASANRFGVALWTAHDYFSFQKDWGMQVRRPYSIFRVPNPVNFWYKSEMTDVPMVYIADERASKNNNIVVFSNCDEVELYNDGKLVARQKPDDDPNRAFCNSPSYTFRLVGEYGDLTAKGFIRGQQVADYTLNKYGKAYQLQLELEDQNADILASGGDMRMVRAYIVDKDGNKVVGDNETMVSFKIEGEGVLIGGKEIGANPNKSYWGTASIILNSTLNAGKFKITAKAKGLKSATLEGETFPYSTDMRKKEISDVNDFPIVKVDLGGKDQLLQFDWNRWDENKSFTLKDYENAEVSVTAKNGDLKWNTAFGLLGNLPYLAMDGVTAKADDQIELTFNNLPKGKYELTTYHHSIKVLARVKGNAILEKKLNTYQISVKDNKGNRMPIPAIEPTSGVKLGNLYPAKATYYIYSDGQSAVKVIVQNYAQDVPVVLNGFEIKQRVSEEKLKQTL
ncbi:glycoside hydrolase family 2 protein [Flammeovirga sp. MY04]|uniref:glycoside hydrolase family 2 protein n=1 Tax=Flammeovirga sp. MY04 TaxID=1191459 RepID=UPI0008060944|nr:glycoside hydrolase family 2 TIM barrel-domain containing protein [Flammeovirga sp. MY04]ANQ51561.1 glycoside hydrolase family 2 protein [Flammeovirga sp. MY04]